jgi:hypothetical protein
VNHLCWRASKLSDSKVALNKELWRTVMLSYSWSSFVSPDSDAQLAAPASSPLDAALRL